MSASDDPLEAELRTHKPRPLSQTVRARIELRLRDGDGRIGGAAEVAGRSRWFWLAGLGAAAALLAFLGAGLWVLSTRQRAQPEMVEAPAPKKEEPSDTYRLVSTETVLLDQRDEGTCVHPEGGAARKFRVRCVDHMEWRNPRRGQTFRMTTPREEVRFVSLETY